MQRTRTNPAAAFVQPDGRPAYRRREEAVDNVAVELFYKLREYRPYLKKRLGNIVRDGRERECKDEVEDIKYYLSVMSDMLADENHGAETLQGFLDRIHEMIRKNPINEHLSSDYENLGNNYDDEQDSAPRSPSPIEVIDCSSDAPATARTIPLEREKPGEFSYFQHLEETVENPGSKLINPPRTHWDPKEYDGSTSYTRRGSYQDIDMRRDANSKPISNSRPLGRGSGVSSSSSYPGWGESDNSSRSDSYKVSGHKDKDKDERYNRDRDAYRARSSDSSRYRENERESSPWEDDDWGSGSSMRRQGYRNNTDNAENNYDRRGRGNSRDYSSHVNQPRSNIGSQDFSNYDRSNNSDKNFSSFDRRQPPPSEQQQPRTIDESLFDRRPSFQFERRQRNPSTSGNTRDNEAPSVQFEYNHGGNDAAGQSWEDPSVGLNYPTVANSANLFNNSYEVPQQQQQQQFLNPNLTPLGYGLNPTVGSFGINPVVPSSHAMGINQSQGSAMPIRIPQGIPPYSQQQPILNNRPGLLPNPSQVLTPQNTPGFGFRNPNGYQPVRHPVPQDAMRNMNINSAANPTAPTSSNASMSVLEISKQKAQQCFSQPRGSPRGSSSAIPRLPIASNQMVSNIRDPRLSKQYNKNKGLQPSHTNDSSNPNKKSMTDIESRRVSDSRDRVLRDPRGERNTERDRERNNRDQINNANKDPRHKSNQERDSISIQDPRLIRDRKRDENSQSESTEARSSSKSQNSATYDNGKTNDRGRSVDSRGAQNSRDDSRDRTSRVSDTDDKMRRLDEVRNRVRANIVPPKTIKTVVPPQLKEIRKQAMKEGFHTLGRPGGAKKNQTSFDEAIVVPIEKPSIPHKSPQAKSGTGNKNKDNENSNTEVSKKKGIKKKTTETSPADSGSKKSSTKRHRIIVHDSDESDIEIAKKGTRKPRKKKSDVTSKKLSGAQQADSSTIPPKKTVFRIPKIKKPDPPPAPESPDLQENSYVEHSSVSEETVTSGLTRDTELLIKQFILQSVDPTEAENIFKSQDAISLVFKKLKEQVKLMCHDEQPTAESSSTPVKPTTSSVQEDETLFDIPSQPSSSEDPKDLEVPGSHRSRSVTKKKNAKRRSSLEKLHDALKEMRFDTMLPLGPRRCTRGPVENVVPEVVVLQPNSVDTSTTEPLIQFNREDFNSILTNPHNDENNTASISEQPPPITTGKRGRKRKRKTSQIKQSKKKKGPVTRAQAAIKTAIKVHQNQGTEVKRKKTKAGGSKSTERVTRSMIGRTCIVTNIGLEKVKLENDYIPPKAEPTEPEDLFNSDFITAGSEFEHYQGQTDNEQIEHPSFMQNIVDAGQEEDPMSMSMDQSEDTIGKDPLNTSITDERENVVHIKEEQNEKDDSQPIVKSEEFEEPEEYADCENDLSFLPDLPVINCVFSASTDEGRKLLDNLINKVVNKPDQLEEPIPDKEILRRSESRSTSCDSLLDWMVSTVEYENEDGTKSTSKPSSPLQPVLDPIAEVLSSPLSIGNEGKKVEHNPDFDLIFLSSDDENPEDEYVKHLNDYYDASDSEDEGAPSKKSRNKFCKSNKKTLLKTEETETEVLIDKITNFSKEISKVEEQMHNPPPFLSPEYKEDFDLKRLNGVKCTAKERLEELDKAVEEIVINEKNEVNTSVNKNEFDINKQPDEKNISKITQMADTESQIKTDMPTENQPSNEKFSEDIGEDRKTSLEGASLYICANEPCPFTAVNSTLFKDHITSCMFTPENKTVKCYHCDKRVKAIPHLLEHLKLHGHKKQFCSLCIFRTWTNSELIRHLKSYHKVYNFKMVKIERGAEEDPDFVVFPKEAAARMLSLEQLNDSYARHADRLVFGPQDMDKVPARHIFHTLAYCSECSYSTKVRVNFIRHLKLHLNGVIISDEQIPTSDPVNPVPCLERKELMFDKMTNWAGSTHAHKVIATDNSAVPQFVLDQFRYVCNVAGCEQITTDEYMLRTHIRTLHSDVETYVCPHCFKNESTKNDMRNSVPVDKLGNHLKLHGPKLYRCAHCDFINNLVVPMEKHLPDKHPEKKPIHYLIRNLDANGEISTRRSSVEDGNATDKWRCSVCNSKTLFSTYLEAKQHCESIHRISGQFHCVSCRYATDSDIKMKKHILEICQRKASDDGRILVMWIRSEYNDTSKADDAVYGPLWKRGSGHAVKHIRGIFLEETKEKNQQLTKVSTAANYIVNASGTRRIDEMRLNEAKKLLANESISSQVKENDDQISQSLMVCPKCNRYKSKSRRDMTVHLHNEMAYQRYRCTKCSLKFVTENSLKGHVTGDHGMNYNESSREILPEDPEIEAYVEKCLEKGIVTPASFPKENLTDLEQKIESEGNLRCSFCCQEFQSGHNLRTHLLAKHLATNMYVCGHCQQGFWNKKMAKTHHEKMHQNQTLWLDEDEKLASSFTPDFWYREYGIFVKEKKKTSSPKKESQQLANHPLEFGCPHCSFESNSKSEVESHINSIHAPQLLSDIGPDLEKDSIARVASETFDDSEDIEFLGGFPSPEAFVFSNNSSNKALLKGDNANIYNCFHCNENFFTLRGVRSHWQKIHSDKPEERCNYYEYKTVNDDFELPPWMELNCSYCEYKTSSFSYIQTHHDEKHQDKPFRLKRGKRSGNTSYVCEYCFYENCQYTSVKVHSKLVHPDVPLKYTMIDSLKERQERYESYGKLIEDSVRFLCPTCQNESVSREEHRQHVALAHQNENVVRESGFKFSRHILNSKIKVPTGQVLNNASNGVMYKCPVCEYITNDKEQLTDEHLTNHLYVYMCPNCQILFQTARDAKFHIRHAHGDIKATAFLNESVVSALKLLEDVIEEVSAPVPSSQVNQISPRKYGKKKKNLSTEDDDLFIDEVIIVNSSSINKTGQASVPVTPQNNKSVGNITFQRPGTSASTSVAVAGSSKSSQQNEAWNLFDTYVDIAGKTKTLSSNPLDPELIEIPGVDSDQWNLDLADFSNMEEEEDPFITSWDWD